MKISVIMPVYNEGHTIREAVRRVLASPLVDEFVVVDDGSTDGTPRHLSRLAERAGREGSVFRVVRREQRGGKGCAVRMGLGAVTGDVIVVHDADLEYDPVDFPALVDPIRDGQADAVLGSRFTGPRRRLMMFWHAVANRLFNLAANVLLDLNMTDIWAGSKAFRAAVLKTVPLVSRGFDVEVEVVVKLAKLGCRLVEVPVSYNGRTRAEGKKLRGEHALLGLWRLLATFFWGDLGSMAVGEQTLRIMARASRYNLYLNDLIRPHLGDRVMEMGAGMGNMSRFLLDRDCLTLVEPNPAYADFLQNTYHGWEGLDVQTGDALREAPPDLARRYDSVVCLNVLEHILDDERAVRNMAGYLRPGGRLIILVPSHPFLHETLDRALGHHRRYTRERLTELFRGSGFVLREIRHLNPLAIPGWWVNGKIFRRTMIPNFQLQLFDRLTPVVRLLDAIRWPFGLSLLCVGERQ